jgi:hypothetical protein
MTLAGLPALIQELRSPGGKILPRTSTGLLAWELERPDYASGRGVWNST